MEVQKSKAKVNAARMVQKGPKPKAATKVATKAATEAVPKVAAKKSRKGLTALTRRQWSKNEDKYLVESLTEIWQAGDWKAENGFKNGYLNHLERMLAEKIPDSKLKATPHIESRIKLLKRQAQAIQEMTIEKGSGFGWNDVEKCLTCSKDVFDEWVKSHKQAKGLRNKPFPHLDALLDIYGKERATGDRAETAADAVEHMENEDEYEDEAYEDDDEAGEDVDEAGEDADEAENETFVDANEQVVEEGGGDAEPANTPRQAETVYVEASVNNAATSAPSRKPVTSRKRSRSGDDGFVELVERIDLIAGSYEQSNEQITRIATFFENQVNASDRKTAIFQEILDLGGFTNQQVMEAVEHILKDPHKLDVFFSMPKLMRKEYVVKQLCDSDPYRPTFNYDDLDKDM